MKYGRDNESVAIEKFSTLYKKKIVKSGIIVDRRHNFLAASPGNGKKKKAPFLHFCLFPNLTHIFFSDGLVVGENAMVEVKCPFNARDSVSLDQACLEKKVSNSLPITKPVAKYISYRT